MAKEIINWGDEKHELEYFDSNELELLKNITQVYGFLFDKEGKF